MEFISGHFVTIFCSFGIGIQANTHINVHQDLKDVKLWQVLILLLPFMCKPLFIPFGEYDDRSCVLLFVKLGPYSLERIGENSCQCRHSNVGVWGFQFGSWKVCLLF